jgi:thiamine-phosphate pyrophosphorylase
MSKPGYGPSGHFSPQELTDVLTRRTKAERRATVLALGGITVETAPRALALGFDGVAVLGSIWQAAEPVQAFTAIRDSASQAAQNRPKEIRSDNAA